jgi:hypothetical protein
MTPLDKIKSKHDKEVEQATLEFRRLCTTIIEHVQTSTSYSLRVAHTYANAGLHDSRCALLEAMRMQIPYILCNLQAWRGVVARETKEALKELRGRMRQLEREEE